MNSIWGAVRVSALNVGLLAGGLTAGRIALLLVLFALALRLAFVFSISNEIEPLDYDGRVYDLLATRIQDGEGYGYDTDLNRSWRPPFYPFVLAGGYSIFGQNFVLVRVAQALLGAATVFLAFSLARNYLGRYGSALAGTIVALHAGLILMTGRIVTETLFIFLLVAAVVLLQRWFKDWRLIDGIAAGIVLGLACLTRPQALLILPLLLPAMLLLGQDTKTVAKHFLLLLLVVFAAISPWTIRNYLVHDDFVLISTNGGYNFYVGNNPSATGELVSPSFSPDQALQRSELAEAEIDLEYYKWGLEYIIDEPGQAFRLLGTKAKVLLFDPSAGRAKYPELGFLVLAVLGSAMTVRYWRRYALMYLFIAAVLIPPLFFFAEARFRLPATPFLAVFAAAFLVWLAERVTRRAGRAPDTT